MTSISLRRRHALAITLTVALPFAGCYTTHHQRLVDNPALDRITGITMRSGREILFGKPGATISNDTLYARGTVGPLKIPTDSIAQLSSPGFSPGGSFVVIGAAAAVIALLLHIAVTNAGGGS